MNGTDPIFKGCTRPAMMLGVPLVPLTLVCGFVILIGTYAGNLFLNFAIIPLVLIMRAVVATDDQRFRTIGLWIQFRYIHLDLNRKRWNASAYSPLPRKRVKR